MLFQRLKFILSIYLFFVTLTIFSITRSAFADKWYGPSDGPTGQKSKKVIYIALDYQNGGVTGAYRGFESAAKALGWKSSIVNGKGSSEQIKKELFDAIKLHPDGIILGGFQPDEFPEAIKLVRLSKIVIVGWHAATSFGLHKDLFVNVATDSKEVAKTAADYVIKQSNGKAGVVIFNDNRYDVANEKTKWMKEEIEKCKKCKFLSIENVSLSNASFDVPAIIPDLIKKYGKAWTHTLAINDIYFDNMNSPLIEAKRKDILNVSAGDGSNKAISRIKSGLSQQLATVAEPLNTQGWQLADELNRAFAGKEPSGFVTKPILVTKQFLENLKDDNIESDIGYEKGYLKIWKVKK
jgi:ribose transport system substrate-binding protein